MNRITTAHARLAQATDLPSVINAAYEAFEDIMSAIEEHENPAGGAFVPFVMSSAYAANARDALLAAPSLPPPVPGHKANATPDPPSGTTTLQAAIALSDLSGRLVCRLTDAKYLAKDPADKAACAEAVGHSMRIWSTMTAAAGL
jgi:hypothetical protein